MKSELPYSAPCFVAGTEILTAEGEKDIENIEVGDWVIADDPTTPGEIEKRQVLQTFVRSTDTLVDLEIDGEIISTTEEHPFWVPDKGWVEADDLQVGDLLQTEDGILVDIDGINQREGDFEVYNFEVEDFHTYFVSDLEILVHNTCNPYVSKNTSELMKSQKSYQNLIDEHQKKLQDYIENPDAYDNKGILKNADPELRSKIIEGRKKSLQKQIDKQTGELNKIEHELKNRGVI